MQVTDFDFELPDTLIAQEPPSERGGSRLLVLDRASGRIEHRAFAALAEFLGAGDLLVVNNTRVFPARLLGRRLPGGGAVECFLLSPAPGEISSTHEQTWHALLHPGPKLRAGTRLVFERDDAVLHGEVLPERTGGRRTIRLWADAGTTVAQAVDRIGHIPLPPYIRREDTAADRERYQTVFAKQSGSIAAPTAGLHFTPTLLAELQARGVEMAEVTLHVGYGTFKPVRVDEVEAHVVEPEHYRVDAKTADDLTRARRDGRRIIAVGTTTTRVLESLELTDDGRVLPSDGETHAFIYPGHRFQLVQGLVTNFHLPKSSLLMLVCALAGRERVLHAYREAVREGYRFYSYGDAMFVR